MVQYIYFVKCPNCEDEHFDFFDDAKAFALGCLSKQPIITQTEVCRNDFGECTDHSDLGTVWSWEDECGYTDAEPARSVFTKDDLKRMADGFDPEFDDLDNSVDFEVGKPVISEISAIDDVPDNFRNPIPEGMTIKELVEAMEENEDTVECVCCNELNPKEECNHDGKHGWICPDCQDEAVECTWCEELYDKSECRYEVDLGWLCDRCQSAIKSRGESLTFREGNYWDFLDEELKPKTWICEFDGHEIGTVEASTEEEAYDAMEREYPEYHYGLYDGVAMVYPADEDELDGNVKEIHDLGNEYDGGYPAEDPELLTEATFPHFRYSQEDVKQLLVQRILETPGMERYISADGTILRGRANYRNPHVMAGYTFYGNVTGFEVQIPYIIVNFTSEKGISSREELDDFLRGTHSNRPIQRGCDAYILLRKLREVATELNRELNPGVAARRNFAVADAVAEMGDETLEELRTHIKDILFRIPYDGYVEQDIADIDPEASENKRLAKQVVKKLKDLSASFFALDFADNANVETRYIPDSEKAAYILSDWGNEAIIKFDCPISQLSDEAKKLIRDTRFSTADLKENSKQVNNYRLAKELCLRYGAKFYENNNQLNEASLSDIAAAANSEYGTDYSERELLANAGVEDIGFFDDLETPAQISAQAYRNKRRRQAYAIARDKAKRDGSMKEELEDEEPFNSQLVMCPECGFETLDVETGICINCGFNSLI